MRDDVDKLNLDDLEAIQQAITQAKDALEKARIGNSSQDRERLTLNMGFILGRTQRIIHRTYLPNKPRQHPNLNNHTPKPPTILTTRAPR